MPSDVVALWSDGSIVMSRERKLVEGNDWHDRFWGVCRGQGKNHLGKLLMRVRESLR